jgi:hypothetical protein
MTKNRTAASEPRYLEDLLVALSDWVHDPDTPDYDRALTLAEKNLVEAYQNYRAAALNGEGETSDE